MHKNIEVRWTGKANTLQNDIVIYQDTWEEYKMFNKVFNFSLMPFYVQIDEKNTAM